MASVIDTDLTPNPKRIVVLGGSGFLGRSLTVSLAGAGHSVVAASRHPLDSNVDNLSTAKIDFTETDSLEDVLAGCDTVIQLVNGINPSTGNDALIRDIE